MDIAFRTDGKGAALGQSESLEAPSPREIRVRVKAVGLNFRDHYFIRGNRFRAPAMGRVPCTDAVGIVTHVGADVDRFRVGDRVCSVVLPGWIDGPLTMAALSDSLGSEARDGVLRGHVQIDESAWVHAPAYLSDIEAATLSVAAVTAWHAVIELCAVQPGQTIVVQTTGAVALFAMQFALAIGARVIAVSRSEDKLRRVSDLGVGQTIDTSHVPDWDVAVRELTDGKGAKLVIDMGLTDSLRQSVRATAFEGTVAVVGVVQERTNALDIFPVMNKNLRVLGVETGSRAMFERMNAFMSAQDIHPIVDRIFAPDQLDAALDHLASSPFGKTVIRFESDNDGSATQSSDVERR